MQNTDKNALICDFAQYYHVFDYKQLQPMQAAILAVGLPNDSRIKRKLAGQKFDTKTLLLSCIADCVRLLVWFQTKDGHDNRNRPESILNKMMEDEQENEYMSFDSIEAYEAARAKMMENL